MSSILQNILWAALGTILGATVIFMTVKKSRSGKEKTKEKLPLDNTREIHREKEEIKKPTISAKEAFLTNVDKFSSILPQLNNSLDIPSWTEQIVDIDNPQLIALWKRCFKKNATIWKQMLSSWGLRQDTCKSFTYLDKYANMYETSDKSVPEEGTKYRVIDGCWILTDDNSGLKRVIKKGIIEKL